MNTVQMSGDQKLELNEDGKGDVLRLRLSQRLATRVEEIAREMSVTPEEVVKLAIRHVVDVMAPERMAEVRMLMEVPVQTEPLPRMIPGLVERRIRFHTSGGTEITA